MMLLMEKFGGKFTALGDVFNFCSEASLKSREVTLVSLTRMPDGVMSTSKASWTSASSDRFGLKAQSVEDVLAFFTDPKGTCFLFPRGYMGPDVICFLEDKETSELIILLIQARARSTLDSRTWLKSLETVTPEFFYTMIVRVRHFTPYLITDPSLCTVRKTNKGQNTRLLQIQTLRRIWQVSPRPFLGRKTISLSRAFAASFAAQGKIKPRSQSERHPGSFLLLRLLTTNRKSGCARKIRLH
jgi:hypothetical protein